MLTRGTIALKHVRRRLRASTINFQVGELRCVRSIGTLCLDVRSPRYLGWELIASTLINTHHLTFSSRSLMCSSLPFPCLSRIVSSSPSTRQPQDPKISPQFSDANCPSKDPSELTYHRMEISVIPCLLFLRTRSCHFEGISSYGHKRTSLPGLRKTSRTL
ncbi:uncharacterized protein BDR25DRAFT_37520 [Lindgomyces ingoldianus]|uniref:Uncharacterized protein n=1 Tax=Lindgomyces ingoldianus TaxID=673940 RepID=A0ACB6QT10_9PLEO|nr:uncharacterized protein BDR25DRAFT_37520 [Lindgomyces ingoldianus]KAF2470164.1 hypothetical protein BDR25DRAFT_37520 [Lindgomyces ingoldianus]